MIPTSHPTRPRCRWAKAYLETWDRPQARPRIGLSRGVYPAADRRTALAEISEGTLRFAETMIKQGRFPAGLSVEQYAARLHTAYGHPEEVAAALLADQVLPYTTDLILQFNPATPPLEQALRQLEQIATQIAPALDGGVRRSQRPPERPREDAKTRRPEDAKEVCYVNIADCRTDRGSR